MTQAATKVVPGNFYWVRVKSSGAIEGARVFKCSIQLVELNERGEKTAYDPNRYDIEAVEILEEYRKIPVFQDWPNRRDPGLPPFFVYNGGELRRPNYRYRIAGTFRNGVCCLTATPRNMPDRWNSWIDEFEAVRAVTMLNLLHRLGLIDWRGERPRLTDQALTAIAREMGFP